MKCESLSSLVNDVRQCNPEELGRPRITYLDISSVDNGTKRLMAPQRIAIDAAPSRARQLVHADDVLVSTVRPNLNAVALVPVEFHGEIASTGFCVLRPRPKQICPEYLFYFTQSAGFVTHLTTIATGASYPAVTDTDILDVCIPLPELSEQRQIAERLEQADRLRRTRRYALELSDGFLPAAFLELLSQDGDKFPGSTVAELAAERPHAIRTGPFGSQLLHSEFTNSGIAVLGIDNAVSNRFAWDQRRFISPTKYKELKRYTVFPSDVIITIMGTCGRCAIVPDNIPLAINTKHLCCITLDPKRCLPAYLQSAFLYHPFVGRQLHRATKGAIMEGLNMEIIKTLQIPLPPLSLQQRWLLLVQRLERLRSVQCEALRQADHLFQSLLQAAFRGEARTLHAQPSTHAI